MDHARARIPNFRVRKAGRHATNRGCWKPLVVDGRGICAPLIEIWHPSPPMFRQATIWGPNSGRRMTSPLPARTEGFGSLPVRVALPRRAQQPLCTPGMCQSSAPVRSIAPPRDGRQPKPTLTRHGSLHARCRTISRKAGTRKLFPSGKPELKIVSEPSLRSRKPGRSPASFQGRGQSHLS